MTTPRKGKHEDEDPQRIIREGYDKLGRRYQEWSASIDPTAGAWFLAEVLAQLPARANVLELGCGPGVEAAMLAKGHEYTGVDLSEVQLALARKRVPHGTFICGDFTEVDLPHDRFDVVVSLYAFNHVPQARLGPTFRRVFKWLRPGGRFMLSLGTSKNQGAVDEDWLGVPMFFAGHEPEVNERLFAEAGFTVELSEIREADEAEYGKVRFQWVIARK